MHFNVTKCAQSKPSIREARPRECSYATIEKQMKRPHFSEIPPSALMLRSPFRSQIVSVLGLCGMRGSEIPKTLNRTYSLFHGVGTLSDS